MEASLESGPGTLHVASPDYPVQTTGIGIMIRDDATEIVDPEGAGEWQVFHSQMLEVEGNPVQERWSITEKVSSGGRICICICIP